MESVGENSEIHQGVAGLGNFHAESGKARQHRGWLPITQPQQDDWTTCAQPWRESEIMSMNEFLKDAKLTQYNLEFCGWVFCQLSCTQMLMLLEHFVTREELEE